MAAGGGATQVGIATPGPAIGGAGAHFKYYMQLPQQELVVAEVDLVVQDAVQEVQAAVELDQTTELDGGAGTVNTGGGGGGAGFGPTAGGAGGSGIVIIRYKFQIIMSEVKVNKISPRTACGTVTLGDSGDTFTIPSGATITNAGTASGFGATGETSWDTTVKTTGTFTATAGVGYFLNTTGGTITVNLPVGAAGSSVAMADYAGTWQTTM